MKLEEIVPLLRENKKIEYLTFDRNGVKEWRGCRTYPERKMDYCGDILDISLPGLMIAEFRLKKEKVKRYNIVYRYYEANDLYNPYFSITCLKFKDQKDFEDTTSNYRYQFIYLVKESEEEFDE